MRLSLRIPAVVLGVPIPGSENPYLASPIGSLVASITVEECGERRIEVSDRRLKGVLEGFWDRLIRGMELNACSSVKLEEADRAPISGMYASLTVGLLHALARSYGEVLEDYEIIEMARYADGSGAEWGHVLDALRYSTLKGRTVVYRNDEEYTPLSSEELVLKPRGQISLGDPRVTLDRVGSDVYGALIHAMGVAVLEASLRVRDGLGLERVLRDLYPVHEGMLNAVWGVRRGDERCIYSPGLPRRLEVLCWD